LVGWAEAKLPGMEVVPAAPQAQHVALVVAHLRHGSLPDPERDKNARTHVDQEPVRTLTPEKVK
jgi:hypothetical protein